MTKGRVWILALVATLAVAGGAWAKGVVGFQGSVAGGYHRSIGLADNGLDVRAAADLKLGFVAVGISGRFGTDRLDGTGVLRGMGYINLTLMIPLPVVVPYLRIGAGLGRLFPDAQAGSATRIGLHQGIGVDFLIPMHLALGILVDVDESIHRKSGNVDTGLSGLFVVKLRI